MIQPVVQIPEKLTGAEFEDLVEYRGRKMTELGLWHFGKYGVNVAMGRTESGELTARPIKSLPDYECVIPPFGQQIIFDAKACSQASYPIKAEDKRKRRQLDHMIRRAEMGARCFLVIHFNQRELKSRTDEAFTVAIPISLDSDLVNDVLTESVKNLSRSAAQLYGVPIPWNTTPGGRKLTPDLRKLYEPSPEHAASEVF